MNTIVEAIKQTYFSEQIVEPAILDTLVKYQSNPRKLRKELGKLNVEGISDVIRKTVYYTIKTQQEEYDLVDAKNDILINANENLSHEMAHIQAEYETLTAVNQSSNIELVRENEALSYANARIIQTNQSVEADNTVIMQTNNELMNEKTELVRIQTGILAENDTLTNANRTLSQEKNELVRIQTGILAENDTLTNANRTLSQELVRIQTGILAENDTLTNANRVLSDEKAILVTENAALVQANRDLETRNDGLKESNRILIDQIATNAENDNLRNQINDLDNRIAELIRSNNDETTSYQKTIADQRTEIIRANTKITELEQTIIELSKPVSIKPNITIPLEIVGIQ